MAVKIRSAGITLPVKKSDIQLQVVKLMLFFLWFK